MSADLSDPTGSARRLKSLDIFRGMTIVAMIVVNNPGSRADTYGPLLHASWHGWTFADTIFPAFLWIVGLALTLSTRARLDRGADRSQLLGHALRRCLILFCCGLFLEGFPYFELASYQVTGVLQKIAVSYLLAFVIFLYSGWRGQLVAVLGICAAYVVFMVGFPVAGCSAGPWTMECNAANHVDDILLAGHMWVTPSQNDSDGVVGTLSATASVLLGVLSGYFISGGTTGALANIKRLLVVGAGLVVAGLLLSTWIPINKILWTPSYSLFMAGLSSIAFAACHWVVEVRQLGRWFKPLELFGVNALAAYMLSRIGADALKLHVLGRSIYRDFLLPIASPPRASLLFAFLNVAAVYMIIWWMYRLRLFVKL
jgi:predicted acyltransferase